MEHVIRSIEWLTRSLGFTIALLVVPLALAMGYEVLARYVFNSPTIWAYELGYMMTGVHFLLGAAFTLQRGGHIRVDLIYNQLADTKKAWIDLIGYLFLFLPFLVLITVYLWDYAYLALDTGERTGASAWNPPIWPLRMCYVASFALLTLQVVAEICKCLLVISGRTGGVEKGV